MEMARKDKRSQRVTDRLVGSEVLLVEDSRTYAEALRCHFDEYYGIKVTHCASLSELESQLEQNSSRFSIAMVDLNLPGAPGGEALDYLLSKSVPSIVFTATFSQAKRLAVLQKPVADYVLKDGPEALNNLVASAIRLMSNRDIHVLVVDDMTSTRELLSSHLRSQLFRITSVARGEDALAKLKSVADIDLMVCDYEMPKMNGVELVRAIRLDQELDRVRIIGVSSADRPDLMTNFLKAGANDFIHRPFNMDEFYWRVAQNVGTVLQMRGLRELAARDYLTGLYNRRHFFGEGPRQVSTFRNEDIQTPMAMAVMDIDNFKRLNDTYGHEIGDVVLKAVSDRMAEHCGSMHMLARLGGEEFGILIRNLDMGAAKEFCDALRQKIAEKPVPTDDGDLDVTISIGIAEIAEVETFDNYLNAADQFLYMAKHAGRNCVISEEDLSRRQVA